jgi:serine/threonine-protein kinase RsbW
MQDAADQAELSIAQRPLRLDTQASTQAHCRHTLSRFTRSSIMPRSEEGRLTPPETGPINYTLESSLDSVNQLEQTAEQLAQKAGLDEDTVFRVSMAVREAAINAVLHGNAYSPDKRVTASFQTTPNDLIIRITDQGAGLDPDTLPDPLAPENLLRGSGRGIFLIRSFMDEVQFRKLNPGTELTMVKHLPPA